MEEAKLIENVEVLNKLIELLPVGRREKVQEMLDGPLGTAFATAPASSKAHYHECFPGGLLQHSLNVVKNLNKIATAMCPSKYPKEQLVFVALFHDLGKAGDGVNEYYVQTTEKWKKERGELYQINKKLTYMPNAERSVFTLQNYGIKLTDEEFVAIRLNDGQYEECNKGYRSREPELALLLHWADHWSMRQEKLEFSEKNE